MASEDLLQTEGVVITLTTLPLALPPGLVPVDRAAEERAGPGLHRPGFNGGRMLASRRRRSDERGRLAHDVMDQRRVDHG